MTLQIKTIAEYHEAYQQSVADPAAFWAAQARTFEWMQPWTEVFEADMIGAHNKWFLHGKLNITVNCLDRHVATSPDRIAVLWEPNNPAHEFRRITYGELHEEVCRFANGLKTLGVEKGDRICLYMPMIPPLMIAVLACARVGAVHSVVFAGFSALSLADRINDSSCKLVICADYNSRGARDLPIKTIVDEALSHGCPSIEHVIVYQHTGEGVSWNNDRDIWWHDLVEDLSPYCEPEPMDSEDPLFILYTSGSTGKPKGVVHTCGGYMVFASYTFRNVFQYQPDDVFWCTADVGWITGHTYLIYGPLLSNATAVMFEGIPTFPDASRCWQICQKHNVSIFYTAPTAIRALMAAGDEFTKGHDLSRLRILGTVGEPINAEAWHWYQDKIGRGVLPIVDTWWQTETGGIMITPLPGITDQKPCFASYPLPGVQPVLLDPQGNVIEDNEVEGLLCIQFPWPSIIRTTYGDHARCVETYFKSFPGYYFTGDGARRDADGRYRIIGRVDDVINVSGHRLGTAEVENAINQHPDVVESAVVGYPHDIKGQGIYAYVITLQPIDDVLVFQKQLNQTITEIIGPIAKVDTVMVVSGLPKTRSGKIMRRLLRKVAEGDVSQLGDITTLLNPEVVDEILAKSNRIPNSE